MGTQLLVEFPEAVGGRGEAEVDVALGTRHLRHTTAPGVPAPPPLLRERRPSNSLLPQRHL